MKLIKGILGCALAAGLTTLVTSQAQASGHVVIGDELYSPLNIKLVVSANDPDTGKIKQHSVNSKDALKDLGFTAKGEMFAIQIGDGGIGDVFVITKTEVI